jgi:hypothetical protein
VPAMFLALPFIVLGYFILKYTKVRNFLILHVTYHDIDTQPNNLAILEVLL